MRRRGVTYLLAAAMMLGAAAFSEGSDVRADEVIVQTEDGDTDQDDEKQNNIDRPDESSDEGWVTPLIPAEYAYPSVEADEDVSTVTDAEESLTDDYDAEDSAIVDEEDLANSKWISEYDYVLDGDNVILIKYNGTANNIHVYKQARIDGKYYNTLIQGQDFPELFPIYSIWGTINEDSNIKSIIFDDGVKFAKKCNGVFSNCNALENLDLSGVDLSDVTDMTWMFYGCFKLKDINFGNFTASKVTDMSYMFAYCDNLKVLDLSKFNPKKLTGMERMFSDCDRLQTLKLGNIKTDYVTTAACMFSNCHSLTDLDLSKWNFAKLQNDGMTGSAMNMFYNCESLQTLYTPMNLYIDIALPSHMFDPRGNEFTYAPESVDHTKKLVKYYTGWSESFSSLRYLINSEVYIDSTPILGKGWVDGIEGWYVADHGRLDRHFEGIAKMDGSKKWGYAKYGELDKSFSGLATATNGNWYYVNKGYMDKTFTGKLALATNGKWYYVKDGKPTKNFTGKIAETTDGKWYYCTDGKPDLSFSGKIAYCTNGSWYYVTKGRIDRTFTGIATATNGNKYYVEKGLLNKNFTGTVKYNGKTYNIVNGAVK